MHLKLHCFFLKRFEQHHRISHNFLSVNAKPAHNLILNGWGGKQIANLLSVKLLLALVVRDLSDVRFATVSPGAPCVKGTSLSSWRPPTLILDASQW